MDKALLSQRPANCDNEKDFASNTTESLPVYHRDMTETKNNDSNTSFLSVYYQNVRGLRTKVTDLYLSILSNNYDIICFTETWLCDSISSAELIDERYVIFRRDRDKLTSSKSRGGGVLIAVKKCIDSSRVFDLETLNEDIWVKISFHNSYLFICSVYFPPCSALQLYTDLFDSIERNIPISKTMTIIICGDFNLPSINWSDFSPVLSVSNEVENAFVNYLNFHNLLQCNNVLNNSGKTLDLILTNKESTVSNVYESDSPLVTVDSFHPPFTFELSYSKPKRNLKSKITKCYNFRKGDFSLLYRLLYDVNWSVIAKNTDVEIATQDFYCELYRIFDICIPKKRHCSRRYPPWFSHDIINDIRLKYRHRKRYLLSKSTEDLRKFKELRARIKTKVHVSYCDFVLKTENDIVKDPQTFWKFINAKRRDSGIPKTVYFEGKSFEGTQNVVNAFATFFRSVYLPNEFGTVTDLSVFDKSSIDSYSCTDSFSALSVEETEIYDAVHRIKSRKSFGPDNVPFYIIKACIEIFCKPLCIIFNQSLKSGIFPSLWKQSRITPVLKKGNGAQVENYRPVSIICGFAKIFESVIYNRLYQHFQCVLNPNQHGFVHCRSTTTNLLHFVEEISLTFENNSQTDTIYTDFTKAFDRVSFPILIKKLSLLGCTPNILDWFTSYLTNRTQSVTLNGVKSNDYVNTSGVPQGSNLGPLLFLVYVNDLPSFIKYSNCLMYADDLKLFKRVNSLQDCIMLQDDLDSLLLWCDLNKLSLNVDKCKHVLFSMKHHAILHCYTVANTHLERVQTISDLGIIFDSRLTFSDHVKNIVKCSYRNLGFLIRQASSMKNRKTLSRLYETLVRPKLEYGDIIWDPHCKKYIAEIEKVQKKFLRFMYFKLHNVYMRDLPSCVMLDTMNMTTLQKRRYCHRLLFLYKLFNNKIDDAEILQKVKLNVPSFLLRSHEIFHIDTARTNVRFMSPLIRMARTYNEVANVLDMNYMNLREFRETLFNIVHISS